MQQSRKSTSSAVWALCALLIAGLGGWNFASADIISITTSASYGPSDTPVQTNWNSLLNIQQFDPNLGPLLAIQVNFESQVSGSTKIENYLNSSASTYTTSNQAAVTVKDTNNNVIYNSGSTTFNHTANLTSYDGSLDFAGTSGVSYTDKGALAGTQFVLFSGDPDFSMFVGPGTINLPAVAVGQSNWSATSGNTVPIIKTFAFVEVDVTYTYLAVGSAPLPQAAWGGIALLGLLAAVRIRKAIH